MKTPLLDGVNDDVERGAAPRGGSKLPGKKGPRSGKELWALAKRKTVDRNKSRGAFRRLFGPQKALYPVHKDHAKEVVPHKASPMWRRKLRTAQIKTHLLLEKRGVELTMLSLVVIDVLIML